MDPNIETTKKTFFYSYMEKIIFFYKTKKRLFYFLISFFLAFFITIFLISAPKDFKTNTIITIEKGETLSQIGNSLKEASYVRSKTIFQMLVIMLGGEKKIIAGSYILKDKENTAKIAKRFIEGDFGIEEVKVTLREGLNRMEIARILESQIINFKTSEFLEKTKDDEGYLFPDTYFFSPVANPDEVIYKMKSEYEKVINNFREDIKRFGKTEKEIITMASILEGEANDKESREIVAGILWQRIKQKIPLQVDATFKYINGKGTFELTLDDLKIKSPYNTYEKLGLPPTPINNPGEEAIHSALNPKKTPYLYFLTGKDGKMYYAKTFDEHKRNKEKYLR